MGKRKNPDLFDAIVPGARVTITTRHGSKQTGQAVMRGPGGWVLNLGGKHGTPGIATRDNVDSVNLPKDPGKYRAWGILSGRQKNPCHAAKNPGKSPHWSTRVDAYTGRKSYASKFQGFDLVVRENTSGNSWAWEVYDGGRLGDAGYSPSAPRAKAAAYLALPVRKTRNPDEQSDDYNAGVFAGAMEHGKLPPPKTAAAPYRQGYADGAKVAAQATGHALVGLGVYRATRDQAQAGREIRQGILDTPQRNPGRAGGKAGKRRNPGSVDPEEPPHAVVEAAFDARDWHAGQGSGLYALSGGRWYYLKPGDYRKAAQEYEAGAANTRHDADVDPDTLKQHARALRKWAAALEAAGYGDPEQNPRKGKGCKSPNPKAGFSSRTERLLWEMPSGQNLLIGKHTVRRLDGKGFWIVDGRRLSLNEAVAAVRKK